VWHATISKLIPGNQQEAKNIVSLYKVIPFPINTKNDTAQNWRGTSFTCSFIHYFSNESFIWLLTLLLAGSHEG
jgi:hypothetical protein